MDGWLLVFYLPERSPLDLHRRFRKRIYGEETSAGGGRWRYRRKGVLDEVPHVLLYTGVVIVREEDATRIGRAVRQNGGKLHRRVVTLTPGDCRVLGVEPG